MNVAQFRPVGFARSEKRRVPGPRRKKKPLSREPRLLKTTGKPGGHGAVLPVAALRLGAETETFVLYRVDVPILSVLLSTADFCDSLDDGSLVFHRSMPVLKSQSLDPSVST